MRNTNNKKLKLHTETLRNLQPHELRQVAGGLIKESGGNVCYPTASEVAAGCTVTDDTCDSTCSWMWMC